MRYTTDFKNLDDTVIRTYITQSLDLINNFDKKTNICFICKNEKKEIVFTIIEDGKKIDPDKFIFMEDSKSFLFSISNKLKVRNLELFDSMFDTSYLSLYQSMMENDDYVHYDVDKFILEQLISNHKEEAYEFVLKISFIFITQMMEDPQYKELKKLFLENE